MRKRTIKKLKEKYGHEWLILTPAQLEKFCTEKEIEQHQEFKKDILKFLEGKINEVNEPTCVRVTASSHAKAYLRAKLSHKEIEEFHVLLLDAGGRLLKDVCITTGTVDKTAVYSREIIRHVIKENAVSVILAHNHPGGVREASAQDKLITEKIKAALDTIDMNLLDHLIVCEDEVISFREMSFL